MIGSHTVYFMNKWCFLQFFYNFLYCTKCLFSLKSCFSVHTHPGVANCELEEATAISQLATNWHPVAVASPVNYIKNEPSINYKKLLCESCRAKRLMTMEAYMHLFFL